MSAHGLAVSDVMHYVSKNMVETSFGRNGKTIVVYCKKHRLKVQANNKLRNYSVFSVVVWNLVRRLYLRYTILKNCS